MNASAIEALRSLFDLYSPKPLARVVVLATMALGVYLLFVGAATGSGTGAIPFLILVLANYRRFLATVEGLLESHGWLIVGIPLVVFVAKMVMTPPTANDDLLRHIASAFWPGGYRDMYVYAQVPEIEYYAVFDWLVRGLARSIGPAPAMWTIQALAFGSFVVIFVLVARRFVAGNSLASVLILAALVLALQVTYGRLVLARPEMFVTIWALAAPLILGSLGTIAWIGAGMLLSCGYLLAPVYFPAVLLLPHARRTRAVLFALLAACWAVFWLWMTGGALLDSLILPFRLMGARETGVQVSENVSIVNLLLMPQMLSLLLGAVWASRRSGVDHRFLLLAGYFMLSNQVRYGGVIAPLLTFYVLTALRAIEIPWPPLTRTIATALGIACFSVLSAEVPLYSALPKFELPSGAVVLSAHSEASYSNFFVNPGRIKGAPIYEIGAVEQPVQRLVIELGRGRLDCTALDGLGFTHVVENSLTGTAPACLELDATQAGWRLWRVRR